MRLLSLLSGGIDSAVASALMLRQGHTVDLVHFHNSQLNAAAVEGKILRIAEALCRHGTPTLHLVPFKDAQHAIIKAVPAEARMIVYRRMMFRMATALAKREGHAALLTGDNLGQVASQTPPNLRSIHLAAGLPVYTPLLGEDKQDIIRKAKELGTYEATILPYNDCCSYLVARHPRTRSTPEEMEAYEQELDIPRLIADALAAIRTVQAAELRTAG
jgi:thiamine biosynthesis protein ThiI